MSEPLLTAHQVAELLGVKADWVLDQWQAGDLPGFRLSQRLVRFRESEIEAYLQSKHEGPRIVPDRHLRSVGV